MLTIGVTLYSLLYVFGQWSGHSGLGAFFVFVIWILFMLYGLVLAFLAPWWPCKLASMVIAHCWGKEAGRTALNIFDAIDLLVNGVTFFVPALCFAFFATVFYFLGLGDGIVQSVSEYMGWRGFLLSVGYLLFETWSMLGRFGQTDAIKDAVKAWGGRTSGNLAVYWNRQRPLVQAKSREWWSATSRNGTSFFLLFRELFRHCQMRIQLSRRSREVIASCGQPQQGEATERLLSAQQIYAEHTAELGRLWRECRWLVLVIGLLSLAVLVIILVIFLM